MIRTSLTGEELKSVFCFFAENRSGHGDSQNKGTLNLKIQKVMFKSLKVNTLIIH